MSEAHDQVVDVCYGQHESDLLSGVPHIPVLGLLLITNLSIATRLEWETFFAVNPPPTSFKEAQVRIAEFCALQRERGTPTVLVTSGGTTVPLEHNTVRFVDNFSAGTRGASSAEYFLKQGYAVLFMHRQKSLEPFSRHFASSSLLNSLEEMPDGRIIVRPEDTPKIQPILKDHHRCQDEKRLLKEPFTTLSSYLWLLRSASQELEKSGPKAMFYLAAAVSDFYIPQERLPTHKIHSSGKPPVIQLEIVPKMLRPLTALWVPHAFVVSFKLETDESVLIPKAREALLKYQHRLVVANLLHNRARKVILVPPEPEELLTLEISDEESRSGVEIEERIVAELVRRHRHFVQDSAS